MGIGFTYKKGENKDHAGWSYSGFNRFREKVAESVGIPIREMDGWKTDNGNHFGSYIKGISWRTIKNPIKYLLNHSDCDGYISPKRCGEIAPVLKKMVSKWEHDYDRENGLLLAKNMSDAYKTNSRLYFC